MATTNGVATPPKESGGGGGGGGGGGDIGPHSAATATQTITVTKASADWATTNSIGIAQSTAKVPENNSA